MSDGRQQSSAISKAPQSPTLTNYVHEEGKMKKNWRELISQPQYGIKEERDIYVPMYDGGAHPTTVDIVDSN